MLGLNEEGLPLLELRDSKEQPRALFLMKADDTPKLIFLNQGRSGGFAVGLTPTGEPGILLGDAAGHQRLALVVKADGTPGLVFFDPNGRPRLDVSVDRTGAPRVDFLDPEGRPVSRLPAR